MKGRWKLLLLIFGLTVDSGSLPSRCAAQAPLVRVPGNRPEDPRIVALRQRMRSGAFSVKPEDVGKLITPQSPLTPAKPAAAQNPSDAVTTKTSHTYTMVASLVTKPAAKDQKATASAPAPQAPQIPTTQSAPMKTPASSRAGNSTSIAWVADGLPSSGSSSSAGKARLDFCCQ